jgi:hypothetical protein
VFVLDGAAVLEPDDLARAADCERAVLHEVEVRLGVAPRLPGGAAEAVAGRSTGARGEARRSAGAPGEAGRTRAGSADHDVLAALRGAFGRAGVRELPAPHDGPSLRAHHDATLTALRAGGVTVHGGIETVHGGGFFDGRFHGRVDLLIRDGEAWVAHEVLSPGRTWRESSFRLAACYDGLTRAGVPMAVDARMLLADGTPTRLDLTAVVPGYRSSRARLDTLVGERLHGPAARPPIPVRECGRCPVCRPAAPSGTSRHL